MINPEETQFSRTNPFIAKIKERKRLSKIGSKKSTHYISLDISGSNIHYNVGDSIGIYPINDPQLIEWTLKAMNATGDELVTDKHGENSRPLKVFLKEKANITEFSKNFLKEIAKKQNDPIKKAKLESFFLEDQKEALKEFLLAYELWHVLEENKEAAFEIQELCNLLMPLLPRLYSISSSKNAVGNEVHLTVAMLEYESNQLLRRGVCTHYLCNLAPLNDPVVPIYIHPHNGFTIPENENTPMIMIGPGTGIAPFRAFLQERMHKQSKGKNWLIFGEWNRNFDFFYEDYWNELVASDQLRLHSAFSRDEAHKVYVQHRMLENGQEIFDWLQNGAHFYVCGDAKRMARDVEATLLQIISEFGKLDEVEAKAYLKELRVNKRYLRDVY